MKKFILLFTFTVVSLMLTANASARTIVTDGLVSYWNFDRTTITDRTVEDVWGENHATIKGNPKIVRAYLKQGLELDGSGDYVSLPNVGNFGSRIGPYTFEAWFKTSYKESWSAIYKVNEEPCARHNNGHAILLNAWWGIGRPRIIETIEDNIFFQRARKSRNGCASRSSARRYPVSDGEWHHIALTSRAPNNEELQKLNNVQRPPGIPVPPPAEVEHCYSIALYLDMDRITGALGCSAPKEIIPYTLPIFLGAVNDQGKASGFFQGIFDEVRIYDRAFTHEEVIRNYESGIGLSVEPIQKLPTVWGALKAKR